MRHFLTVKMLKPLALSLGIVSATAFFFVFYCQNSLAAEAIMWDVPGTYYPGDHTWAKSEWPFAVGFTTASTTNISKVSFYSGADGLSYLLCKTSGNACNYNDDGENDREDFIDLTEAWSCAPGDTLVQYAATTTTDLGGGWTSFKVRDVNGDPVSIQYGSGYYFVFFDPVGSSANVELIQNATGTGSYIFWADLAAQDSIQIKYYYDDEYYREDIEVEIIETPGWEGEVHIGSQYDISYIAKQQCLIGESCLFWFHYGYESIGGDVYLIENNGQPITPDHAIASRELIDGAILQDYFVLPSQGEETELNYCIYLTIPGQEDKYYCDVNIFWVEDYGLLDMSHCSSENVCASISTTSNDFLWGIQCGFREVLCWLFNPNDFSINTLSKSALDLSAAFPFNSYFSLTNIVKNELSAATTSTSTLGIPFADTEGNFVIIPVITSSTMSNVIGEENNNTYRTTLGYLMWLITAGIIFLIVWKFR